MKKFKIYNTYHKTAEIVEGETLEEVIKENEFRISITAEWIAEIEVKYVWADYADYFETYDEAFNTMYDEIFEELKSEFEYSLHSEKNL